LQSGSCKTGTKTNAAQKAEAATANKKLQTTTNAGSSRAH